MISFCNQQFTAKYAQSLHFLCHYTIGEMNNGQQPLDTTYTTFTEDGHCWAEAAYASCAAMSELAIEELRRNRGPFDYRTTENPACERFQNPADHVKEHLLQKPGQFARKACFTKTPTFQDGPWKEQFSCMPLERLQFDKWTRAKGGSQK
jgi:hypothetical protein